MRNRITRYEVILTNGQASYLVRYTPRKSFNGLLDAMRSAGQDILTVTQMPEDARVERTAGGLVFSNGWTVRFSGRTQIDAQDSQELTFVGHAAHETADPHCTCNDCLDSFEQRTA